MRYVSSLGDTVEFVPESIVKDFEFRYGEPQTVKEYPPAWIGDPILVDTSLPPKTSVVIRTIEVKVTNFLNDEKVLYREWSKPDWPESIRKIHGIDDRFKIVPVAEVLERVLARGASGPIDELKALLPSKLPNRPPSYSSYDPNHAISTDGKPLGQSDLEKGEPENGESPSSPKRPNDGHYQLTVAYVKWLESPDGYDAVCALKRITATMLTSDDVVKAFCKHVRRNKPRLPRLEKTDDVLRKVLRENSELKSRVLTVFRKIREERANG